MSDKVYGYHCGFGPYTGVSRYRGLSSKQCTLISNSASLDSSAKILRSRASSGLFIFNPVFGLALIQLTRLLHFRNNTGNCLRIEISPSLHNNHNHTPLPQDNPTNHILHNKTSQYFLDIVRIHQ